MKIYWQYIRISILLFSIAAFTSCKKDESAVNNPVQYSDKDIVDFVEYEGNSNSDIVVINSQGGPISFLDHEGFTQMVNDSNMETAFHVNVHQVQTKEPDKFIKEVSFDEAKKYDLESITYLKKVIDHFKAIPNKRVYVVGISFGAFVVQELIAQHGTDVADGYMIMVGRLDMDEQIWTTFSRGDLARFQYDAEGNYTFVYKKVENDDNHKSMNKLAAGLGHHRYTDRLANMESLEKVTYVFGDRDESVGPLSEKEVNFLNQKNARVIHVKLGTHFSASTKGIEIMKSVFK